MPCERRHEGQVSPSVPVYGGERSVAPEEPVIGTGAQVAFMIVSHYFLLRAGAGGGGILRVRHIDGGEGALVPEESVEDQTGTQE